MVIEKRSARENASSPLLTASSSMDPVVVPPGAGHRVRTREVAAPPGTSVLVPPGNEHGFRNDGATPVRMVNVHAPAGFDRRIGLADQDATAIILPEPSS